MKLEDDEICSHIEPIDQRFKFDYMVYQLAGDMMKDEEWIWHHVTYEEAIKRGFLNRYRSWWTEEHARLTKQFHA